VATAPPHAVSLANKTRGPVGSDPPYGATSPGRLFALADVVRRLGWTSPIAHQHSFYRRCACGRGPEPADRLISSPAHIGAGPASFARWPTPSLAAISRSPVQRRPLGADRSEVLLAVLAGQLRRGIVRARRSRRPHTMSSIVPATHPVALLAAFSEGGQPSDIETPESVAVFPGCGSGEHNVFCKYPWLVSSSFVGELSYQIARQQKGC